MASIIVQKGRGMAAQATAGVVQDFNHEKNKAFIRTSGSIAKRDDLVEETIRAAAAGVGFISEAMHYRRYKTKATVGDPLQQPKSVDETKIQEVVLEQTQELDNKDEETVAMRDTERESTKTETETETESKSSKDSKDLATAFLNRHPNNPKADMDTESNPRIALPIVLPQRRPETRTRGFVRGYAPVLADAGIDQETFLDFVDSLNKSLIPNPWIEAINLASLVEFASPDPATMVIGYTLEVATEAAMEAHSRFQSSKFLGRVNADFFLPRGLVCFVATWRSDLGAEELQVDFEGRATIAAAAAASGSKKTLAQQMKDVVTLKSSPGEEWRRVGEALKPSSSAFACCEPAPLVFQSPEEMAAAKVTANGGKKKNFFDRTEVWIDEYMDKRAQALWTETNPELSSSSLMPRSEFRSRYADPKHPASSGDVVAFVTGGRWQQPGKEKKMKEKMMKEEKEKMMKEEKEKKKKEKREKEKKTELAVSESDGEKSESKSKKAAKEEDKKASKRKGKSSFSTKPEDVLKSLFQKDVLYLIITNTRSHDETTRNDRASIISLQSQKE